MVIMANMANSDKMMKTSAKTIDPILSELTSVDASTVKNRFREVAAQAAEAAVAISRYGRPEWVIMSADEFVRLEKSRREPLDVLAGQFDGLVAKMQTAKSQKAVQVLFGAAPADLGNAAVKAAKANAR